MTELKLIQRVFQFIHEWPSTTIEDVWKDDPLLVQHFKEKFNSFTRNDGYASANAILNFALALSDHNRQRLFQYIHEFAQAKENKATESQKKWEYNVLSPDGFPIRAENFPDRISAKQYLRHWITQFHTQGYYASIKGPISLDDLELQCEIIKIPKEE